MIALLFQSCQKGFDETDYPTNEPQIISQTQNVDGAPTVLGNQYTIPFKLDVMNQAKTSLAGKQIISPNNFNVRGTHLYVKFTPTDETQMDILEQDSTLDISSIPKDYLIAVEGSWYRAPNLHDSVPSPQYASVKINYNFPSTIDYQILDTLYVPDEDPILLGTNPTPASLHYADMLIHEAFLSIPESLPTEFIPVPGHIDDYGGGITPSPIHGTIRVWDNKLGHFVPLQGVKVESRKHIFGTAYRYGYTNAYGEYSLSGDQVAGNSNYKIKFWNAKFKILRNVFYDRYEINYNNKSRTSFSIDITGDTYAQFCATIFRAAYRYCYGNNLYLKRPSISGSQLRLYARNLKLNNIISGDVVGGSYWAGSRKIYIGRYIDDAGAKFHSDEVYGNTIHEIAHYSHHDLCLTKTGAVTYTTIHNKIRESWANAVSWLLTSKEYNERGITNYGDHTYFPSHRTIYYMQYGHQYWSVAEQPDYTSLFINLVDDYNEFEVEFGYDKIGSVYDVISGYTLHQIEDYALPYSASMINLRNYLDDILPGTITISQLYNLLNQY